MQTEAQTSQGWSRIRPDIRDRPWMARGHRTRAEVKDRGRWRSDKSVLRYEQRARLGQSFQQLPARLRLHLLQCEAKLAGLLLGRTRVEELLWEQTLECVHGASRASTWLISLGAKEGLAKPRLNSIERLLTFMSWTKGLIVIFASAVI